MPRRLRFDPRQKKRLSRKARGSLASLLDRLIDDEVVPGVAVGLVRGGQLVLADARGVCSIDDETSVTRRSIFQLASVSKIVTAVAAMQLVEQGMLDLDANVERYTGFAVRHPQHPRSAITARMLMTHSSSIVDDWDTLEQHYVYDEDCELSLGDFLYRYLVPGGEDYAESNFGDDGPGEASDYANVGIALLGHVIERAAGVPFDQLCHDRIFAPLGMADSTWRITDVDEARVAWPHPEGDDGWEVGGLYSTPDYPDGQLCSTVEDLARFVSATMGWGGSRLIGERTLEQMVEVQDEDLDENQGLVWYWVEGSVDMVGHEGDEGGIATAVWVDPEGEQAAIVLMNGEEGEDDDARGELVEALFEHG